MSNREKYEMIFVECFSIEKQSLEADLLYNSIPAWDSIGHMSMIALVEEKFDIMMDTDDIIDFSSFTKGIEILKKYNVEI